MASKEAFNKICENNENDECVCEYFIVQHGQGTNSESSKENLPIRSRRRSKSRQRSKSRRRSSSENFSNVPENMEIVRMALPGYVVMSTDQTNEVIRDWLEDSDGPGGSLCVLAQTLFSKTRMSTRAKQEDSVDQFHHLQHALQYFLPKDKYTNELLEGDITAVSDNDFGIWKRYYDDGEWGGWEQIFQENQLLKNNTFWADKETENDFDIKYSDAANKSYKSNFNSVSNINDEVFAEAMGRGNLEYRISDIIHYLNKYYNEDECKMRFIFANCSAFGQYKKGDVIGRIKPFALKEQVEYATLLNEQIPDNNHLLGVLWFWINLLDTFHKRLTIAFQGNKNMQKFCDNIRRHQIRESELDDENLSQMKKGERKEIYIVVEQLLKFGEILNKNNTLIDGNSINKFYSQMFEVLDATNKFICEGGISPDRSDGKKLSHQIYNVFKNTELYNFWEEKFSAVGFDIENLNIKQVIRSQPKQKKRAKSKGRKGRNESKNKMESNRSQTRRTTKRTTRRSRVRSVGRKKKETKSSKECKNGICSRVMSVFGRGKTIKRNKYNKNKITRKRKNNKK